MYQVFLKGLDGSTKCLQFAEPEIRALDLKLKIFHVFRIPVALQRLVTGTTNLSDESVLRVSGAHFSGVNLLLRLRAGKGGFGSLLRGAATKAGQKKTSNFDACRDLNGRRLRHVNAEKKLEEWRAQAEERRLEKIAQDFLSKQSKDSQKKNSKGVEEGAKDVEKYREQTSRAMEEVEDAVKDALRTYSNAKRKAADDVCVEKKKRKLWMVDEDDEEDDEEEEMIDVEDGNEADGTDIAAAEDKSFEKEDGTDIHPDEDKSLEKEDGTDIAPDGDNFFEKEDSKSGSSHTSNSHMSADEDTSSSLQKEKGTVLFAECENYVESIVSNRVNGRQDATVHSYSEDDHTTGKSPDQIQENTVSEITENCNSGSTVIQQEIDSVCDSNAVMEPLHFDNFNTVADMEALGLERLKMELQARGLKCGGNLSERAARLFLLKTTPLEMLPKKLFAKSK